MDSKDVFRGLVEEIAYDAASLNCFAFRRGTDVRRGFSLSLGNMVNGFPFILNGIRFANSEVAYICGAFSLDTDAHMNIQRQLVACDNGYLAKKAIRRPNESIKRADWKEFNIQWMLYVVWQKCVGNSDFAKLLCSLPSDSVIIEDSTYQNGPTATVWGTRNIELKKRMNAYKKEIKQLGLTKAEVKRRLDAKRLGELSTVGIFKGKNLMGKILMLCRDALIQGCEPCIDYDVLNAAHIHLLGKKLKFNDLNQAA